MGLLQGAVSCLEKDNLADPTEAMRLLQEALTQTSALGSASGTGGSYFRSPQLENKQQKRRRSSSAESKNKKSKKTTLDIAATTTVIDDDEGKACDEEASL